MRYFLIERQGQGCDYTIGCGLRVTDIQAETREEAVSAAVARIDGTETGDGSSWQRDDYGVAQAELLVVDEVVNLAELLNASAAERSRKKQEAAKLASEERERAEYERLKGKFG